MEINCLLASLLFFVGNILWIVWATLGLVHTQHMTADSVAIVDPAFIKSFFEQRNHYKYLELSASFMNIVAWFLLITPLLQLVWILSLGGKRRIAMHTSITVLVISACMTEGLTLLFQLGMSNQTEFLTTEVNLSNWLGIDDDNIGWRSVEIIMLMFGGMTLWVEAFELLALFLVLNFIYTSCIYLPRDAANMKQQKENQYLLNFQFGFCFVHFGLFIGLLAGVDFITQVLRPVMFTLFAEIGFILGIINRLILLPIWLICFGTQLSVATRSIATAKQQQLQQEEEFVIVQ